MIFVFTSTEEMHGLRLDKALSFHSEIKTRSRAENLLSQGMVLVNGTVQRSSYRVRQNDLIQVTTNETKASEILPYEIDLDILFEDDDILVVNKPAGLVVHPAAGHSDDTLVNALIHHTKDLSMKFGEQRPGIVHRLDKDTSGILVVAKNDFSHEALTKQFKDRTIHRIYFAACTGEPKIASGSIQSFLARHPTDRKRFASLVDQKKKIIRDKNFEPPFGKWASTHYSVIQCLNHEISYLRLKLETGRTHQIRVHLSEMGCPILGDKAYGADKKTKTIANSIKRNIVEQLPHFTLHAAELGFIHPRSLKEVRYSVAWPQAIKNTLQQLGFTCIN